MPSPDDELWEKIAPRMAEGAEGSNGTFTMQDGSIKGNTAYSYGGGVNLDYAVALAKTGGTIYGNDAADTALRNKVANTGDSTVYTDRGAAVWVAPSSGSTALARLEKTVDNTHNLTKAKTDTTAERLLPPQKAGRNDEADSPQGSAGTAGGVKNEPEVRRTSGLRAPPYSGL
jgi:hypothetical protein